MPSVNILNAKHPKWPGYLLHCAISDIGYSYSSFWGIHDNMCFRKSIKLTKSLEASLDKNYIEELRTKKMKLQIINTILPTKDELVVLS